MKRYICSDLHLGHDNIVNFRQGFISAEEHHEVVFDNLASVAGKRSMVFLLGDIAFSKEWLDKVAALPFAKKVLLLGNHDTDQKTTIKDLVPVYDEIHSLKSYKGVWLSHFPMHPIELRKKIKNVHGHTHPYLMLDSDGNPDPRYVNVCMEYTGMKPLEYEYAVSEEYFESCVELYRKRESVGLIKKD